mmetsp:Transcript_19312/g.56139  ORF Transcript_19312/g.56139 Transcript_19312/m.56139 type:complete len:388 (-) Transcript_19312:51-1214(-)
MDGGQVGVVKTWNGAKGYGFISSEGYSGDIFFSRNELPPDAREVQGTFLQRRAATFELAETNDGKLKATSVRILAVEGLPIFGKVKSFSDKNGYGFLSSSSLTEDVRFMRQDCPPDIVPANLVGELMLFVVLATPQGRLQARDLKFQSGATRAKGAGKGGALPGPAGALAPVLQAALNQLQTNPGAVTVESVVSQLQRAASGGPAPSTDLMTGRVKSFSEKNGYGFITVPGQPGDIKFGMDDVADATAIEAGAMVRFTTVISPDGRLQAKGVEASEGAKRPLPGGGGPILPSSASMKQQRAVAEPWGGGGAITGTGEFATGIVKSFNAAKGFGFISSSEVPGDAYFMRKDLMTPEDATYVAAGSMVSYETAYTPDGKLRAIQITVLS